MVIGVSGRKYRGISLVITQSLLPSSSLSPQSDEGVHVCMRERGHDALVLQRMSSEQPALSASARGGGREEARNRR